MKIIKKYKNRRLYDTDKSQYITFDDLKDDVIANHAFKVIDTSNDADITVQVLGQILVESQLNQAAPLLSEGILRQLIALSNTPWQQHAEALFLNFLKQFSSVNEQKWSTENWMNQSNAMFNEWKKLFSIK